MVTETLVTPLIDSGSEIIDQCRKDNFSIELAFWLKVVDDENWYLYLVTNTMAQDGPRKTYNKLYASWNKLENPFVSYSDIKLIDTTDSLAKSVKELAEQYGRQLNTWFGKKLLGSLEAEKMFIYRIDK